jgi:integrase/recombinase XerC
VEKITSSRISSYPSQAGEEWAIVRVQHATALSSALHWTDFAPDERKRRATLAARDRDFETLWSLTQAALALHSARGAALSPHTLRVYRKGVALALHALEGHSILRPPKDWGALYRADLSAHHRPSTCTVRLAAARALYSALRWSGATDADPLRDVRGVRDPTPPWEKRTEYSDADLEKLLEIADSRERLIVLLGAHAGLRVGDIAALKPADLDLPNRRLRVRQGKGGKARTVGLSTRLSDALAAFPVQSDAKTMLGVGPTRLWQIMRALCERAQAMGLEVPARGVHSLRHSSGTRLYRETGDLLLVRDHLGHASVRSSERYAKGDARARTAVRDW